MKPLQDRYQWQAVRPDESLLTEGGDLSGTVMVSLIPESPLFPRHDFTGLTFIRRFARGFLQAMGGGLQEYLHCIVCQECRIYCRSTTGAILITPAEYEFYLSCTPIPKNLPLS